MGYWYEFKRKYNGEELSFLECGEYKCPYNIYYKSNKIDPDTRQYLLKTEKNVYIIAQKIKNMNLIIKIFV